MSANKTPTIFVALQLTPGQFGLFEEVQLEAVDVLNPSADPSALRAFRHDTGVVFDRGCVRIALGWLAFPDGDVLTLAVGLNPDEPKKTDEQNQAVALFREVVARAEALLEIEHSRWQIAAMALTADAIAKHAEQLLALRAEPDQLADAAFVTFKPEKARAPVTPPVTTDSPLVEGAAMANAQGDEPSWAMQASALTISTAFVLVTPPVGIAMFTYAVLRQGKSMELLPRNLDAAQLFPSEEEKTQKVKAPLMWSPTLRTP